MSSYALCIPFVKPEQQLVDVLTKDLSCKIFHSIKCKMGIRDIHTSSSGGALEITKGLLAINR